MDLALVTQAFSGCVHMMGLATSYAECVTAPASPHSPPGSCIESDGHVRANEEAPTPCVTTEHV